VNIFGVDMPPGLDVTLMLKGFLAAAVELDSERKQRMFRALACGAIIELQEQLVILKNRLDAAGPGK
jgi:hypothetical protein